MPRTTVIQLDEYGEYKIEHLSMVRGGKGKPIKVHLRPRRHIVMPAQKLAPQGWYKNKHEPKTKRSRPCYTEAVLTKPYGGFCSVNCAFCYVNNGTRGYRCTGLPTVAPGYPEYMSRCLGKMMISGAWYITSFSEPFYPKLEKKYHVVQRLSQVLVDNGLPFFYLSKQMPPDWAYDMLQHNPYSYMQFSISTGNGDHWRKLAPGAPDLEDMYDAIYWMHDVGVYVSIQCNPIVPGVSKLSDIVGLCHEVADAGAQHIIFKFVEQVFNNRQVIVDRMRERKLPGADKFDKLFSQVIGGVYTVQEDVRIEWLDALLEETRKVGLTMSLCYEYYDDGASGGNLAPFYTTSDQCHGRGIPMYYRHEYGAQWEPLPGCYRKGCLYCEDYGTKACNHPTLLNAQALTYKDLRTTYLKGVDYYNRWGWKDSCSEPCNAFEYVEEGPLGNPDLQTDAEMWDWELEDGQ